MLLPSYAFLLGIGLILNFKDWRMLGLTLLIGINVFVPIPSYTSFEFYFCCILVELLTILGALLLRAEGTILVIEIAIVLIVAHIMGNALDGFPALSPYRVIVKICEYAQLMTCIMFSRGFLPSIRNRAL